MSNVEHLEFMNKKSKNQGFEIVTLKHFFESVNESFISTSYRTAFYNLIYITEGKCIHEIDFLDYTVNADELLLISRNRVHKYSEFDHVEGYLIMFTEGFLCEFLSNQSTEVKDLFKLSYLNPHINNLDIYAPILKKLLKVIIDLYESNGVFIDNKVIASTFKSFVQLVLNSSLSEGTSKYKKNELFVQFTELVEEQINTEKTVEGYAQMMHVSKKTVNLMTRKAVDMSAKQYISQQLILKIRLKLSFEQKSINEIADLLGFTEPSNMTRFFKKNTGVSPSDFRSMVRRNNNSWIMNESMELNNLKESIEENIYYIASGVVVPLHKHEDQDEIFYCIKGSGFGVLEDGEVPLTVGKSFIAPAGTMHSLRSDDELYVTAFLIPVVDNE